jgi:hypothetical protein
MRKLIFPLLLLAIACIGWGPMMLSSTTRVPNDFTNDPNCVAYYDFENDLNDGCQSNNLTNSGIAFNGSSPLWGTYDGDFEGGDPDHAYITDANLSSDFPGKSGGSTTFTVCVRMDWESTDEFGSMVSKFDYNNGKRCWALSINNVDSKIDFSLGYDAGASYSVVGNHLTAISTGTHYVVCAGYNETDDDAYVMIRNADSSCATIGSDIDSTSALDAETWNDTEDAEFQVGLYDTSVAEPYDGNLDEVVIFKKELTPQEVTDICNGVYYF